MGVEECGVTANVQGFHFGVIKCSGIRYVIVVPSRGEEQ